MTQRLAALARRATAASPQSIRVDSLDEAHRVAVRTSLLAAAATGAVAYSVGALRGAGNFIPLFEFEWRGPGREEEQVVTRLELDPDGKRRITRTTTTITDQGQRRVQKESLSSPDGQSKPRSLGPLSSLLGQKWALPSDDTLAGRIVQNAIGITGSALWCAVCTLPVARADWRYAMFGSRALILQSQPAFVGATVGLRVLIMSWLGGAFVAGTVGSGGIALVGIPSAIIAGMPLLLTGLVIYPIAHSHVAVRIVRKCIL